MVFGFQAILKSGFVLICFMAFVVEWFNTRDSFFGQLEMAKEKNTQRDIERVDEQISVGLANTHGVIIHMGRMPCRVK